jgi:probable rRNA maturation factor
MRNAAGHLPQVNEMSPDPAEPDIETRHNIAVLVEAEVWRGILPNVAALVRQSAAVALAAAGPQRSAELDIVLVDDGRQRELNRDWRGKDSATNVLAFPSGEDAATLSANVPLLLGDVVLAAETVVREATEQKRSVADHVRHLTIHGVLHLLGFDHVKPRAAARMEALETTLLASLGVADPYCGESGKSSADVDSMVRAGMR